MEPQTVAQKRKSPDQETTETTTTTSAASALCTNGCGFFGTAATKGMCSKCFHESHPAGADHQETKADRAASVFAAVSSSPPLKKKIKTSVPAIGSSSSDAAAAAVDDTSSSAANTAQQKKQEEEDPAKKTAANRCMTCRKKVGLTGFQCRCGGTYCGCHRYADAHACGFDYKAAGREQIAKQNPLVVAAKLAKI
ncbi:hypothetical protein PR202_ga13750 [Eleusine coracana subsp. coracana]|uniref:Uncharacterized protein n=1 Tax=Eleusine coracana subsp. coracana TaxID=191504 RepID=A0AAV5CEV1_ELECO|nr:hypothetical protein QOZ80_3AG0212990 [Eleusine coracana subsp. coracana]GJM96877.1 hypothetical protein PR202_ga13750 [Eleusine coracana subsp. coracana]